MKVSRDELVSLFATMGFATAQKWTPQVLEGKLAKIQSLMDDDVVIKDKDQARLLKNITVAQKKGDKITIVFENEKDEPEEVTAVKKKHAEKILGKGKKGKTKPEPEDDEDDEDEDEDEDEGDEEEEVEDESDDDEDEEEEPPVKRGRGRPKKVVEEDEDEDDDDGDEDDDGDDDEDGGSDDEDDDDGDDGDDSDEDDEEDGDDDDDDDDEEEPVKKKSTVKAKEKESPKKSVKTTVKDKGTFPRGEGVIAFIVEMLKEASSKNPISKVEMLKRLKKKFPAKEESALKGTLNTQVPSHLNKKKGMNIKKNELGYFCGKPEKVKEVEADEEEAPVKKKSKKK